MPSSHPVIAAAAAGLYIISESDYPLEVFDLEALNPGGALPSLLLQHLGKAPETPVEEQELAYFLRNHTRQDPGFPEEKNERARRFQHLQAVLEQELQQVKVYRIGQIQVQAFILGRDPEGHITGLKTTQIET